MRLSLRARQVATVTTLVVCGMTALAAVYVSSLARLRLEESGARGDLLARAIFHRARVVVPTAPDPAVALRDDPGIRAILESSIAYTESVTYAAIVDSAGVALAHSSPTLEGSRQPPGVPLSRLLEAGAFAQLRGVYRDTTLEITEPLTQGDTLFGSIRIGLSTVLIRNELERAVQPALVALVITLLAAVVVSFVLTRWALQPIHVIRAGLTQLGRGKPDIRLDLPPGKDFVELGHSFDAISARLSSADAAAVGGAPLESVIERLGDAVAILNTEGAVLFRNSAMANTLPADASPRCLVDGSLPETHPYRRLVTQAVKQRRTIGPVTARMTAGAADADETEREMTAHAFESLEGRFVGIMLVARDIGYLSSVQSTVESSRQVASLSRLLAGVAHEVKNPLNAMTIHLELLRQKIAPSPTAVAPVASPTGSVLGIGASAYQDDDAVKASAATVAAAPARAPEPSRDVLQHVTTIGSEIRRLDEVIQGFLRFIRPDELHQQRVVVSNLIDEVFALVRPEADRRGVTLEHRPQPPTPEVTGDPAMLRQALLNLALNACQAMPGGGTLRIKIRVTTRRVVVDVEDTGVGMPPDVLERIFELYYTTKSDGSGIGLSMVYRIVQLHGGEIEVESTENAGTRFRISLPRAEPAEPAGLLGD